MGNLSRTVFALTAVAFVWVALFGLVQSMNEMQMKKSGGMSGCLFNGGYELCPMNISEHVAHWQAMFAALRAKAFPASAARIMVIVALGVVAIFSSRLFLKQNARLFLRGRLYFQRNQQTHIFDILREAFSSGILNPKIYASQLL